MRKRESLILYNSITNIDSKYIEEAEKAMSKKKNRNRNKMILPVACALLLLICSIAFFKLIKLFDKASLKKPLSVSAAELGKTEILFGATMPDFLYADSDRIVMYDYAGIWEYDLNKKCLSGFCDFRPIGMTQIQGEPHVVVEMSAAGNEVRFYMSDGTKKYLYDLSRNECFEVKEYDTSEYDCFQMKDVSAEKSLSVYSTTYQTKDGKYISYILDEEHTGEDNAPKYGDIRLVMENAGKLEYYAIFQ